MILNLLTLLCGLVLLVGGAFALVKGAASVALRFGVAPLVVGLTVVAFGTSAPELVVSAGAALRGAGGIAIGNVVGSNIANIGLILGLAAIVRPVHIERNLLRRDLPLMLLATGAAAAVLIDASVGRAEGFALVLGLAAYVVWTIRNARREPVPIRTDDLPGLSGPRWADPVWILGGLVALTVGAKLLVDSAVVVASTLGVSNAVIGLTIVGVGTSLPEMATSLVATARGQSSIAAGNVVGSNLFNALGILGVSGLIAPLQAPGLSGVDVAVLAGSAIVLVPMMLTGRAISRSEGAILVLGYAAYVAFLITTVG